MHVLYSAIAGSGKTSTSTFCRSIPRHVDTVCSRTTPQCLSSPQSRRGFALLEDAGSVAPRTNSCFSPCHPVGLTRLALPPPSSPPQKHTRSWLRKRALEREQAAKQIQGAVRRRRDNLRREKTLVAREESVSTNNNRERYCRDLGREKRRWGQPALVPVLSVSFFGLPSFNLVPCVVRLEEMVYSGPGRAAVFFLLLVLKTKSLVQKGISPQKRRGSKRRSSNSLQRFNTVLRAWKNTDHIKLSVFFFFCGYFSAFRLVRCGWRRWSCSGLLVVSSVFFVLSSFVVVCVPHSLALISSLFGSPERVCPRRTLDTQVSCRMNQPHFFEKVARAREPGGGAAPKWQ